MVRIITPKALRLLVLILVVVYASFLLFVYTGGYGVLQAHHSLSPSLSSSSFLPLGVRTQHSRHPQLDTTQQPSVFKQVSGMRIDDLSDVTVMIKTMDRSACVRKLVFDIHTHHPNLSILIADDGEYPSWNKEDDGPYVKYFRMPYDSGLSAGRNLMLSQVQTPYVLLLDDDFLWNISVLHNFIYVMERHPYLDIVGGRAGLHFAGFMHVHNNTLFLIKGKHGVLENTDSITGATGQPCEVVDFVPNFFLARTESLMAIQWHNALKIGEHEEFFMRFNYGNFKAAFCPDIRVINQQTKCAEVDHASAETKRIINRGRARRFIKQGLHMHNLSRVAYCLGEGFVAKTWDRIYDLPDNECFEVPLPEDCPVGWGGEKCEICMPNFFGPHCKPCDCVHGKCEIYPNDTNAVYCDCDLGWYGDKCQKMMQFSQNLVQDHSFASMINPETSSWVKFQDGCESLGDVGMWLINDGQLSCGVSYKLELDKSEVETIQVSVESMSIGVKSPENPASYSLLVEFIFHDGSTQEGLYLPIIPSAVLHTQELLLKPTKPVKTMTIYVVLRKVYGSAYFQNVAVRSQMPLI